MNEMETMLMVTRAPYSSQLKQLNYQDNQLIINLSCREFIRYSKEY